ncbi:MAG: response regulator, partial [Planctomycetota bacterium]
MKRVLVVEDSPTQAAELRLVLESAGFEVESAPDGEKGFELLQASKFDLVISDIVMPGISGYDLCRRIKSDLSRREVPVVLLTTLSDPLDIIQGLECGADNFITKPYEGDYLLSRVGTLMENKRLRNEGKLKVGVEVLFLGRKFTVTSDKEQILDLLITTFEDIVRTNRQLQAKQEELARAKAQIEAYARRLEGEVTVTAEKYRYLMDHANDLILIVDSGRRILEINGRVEEVLGRSRKELLGRDCLDLIAPEEREESVRTFKELLERGGSQFVERHMTRRRGDPIPVEIAASVVDFTGEQRAILAIARDISERKRGEEALRATEAQLRQAQKLEAIGRLAGGVAHDFNNLLTVMSGYSDLLLLRLPPEDANRREIEEVKKAAMRASGLTRQLLAFSRKQVLQPVAVDLNAVVIDLERMLRRLIGEDIQFATQLGSGIGRVLADPSQVEQVIMNLVVNARDAMPQGGRVVLGTGETHLGPSRVYEGEPVRPGPYVRLSVSDTGCGMSEEIRAHIFEPFFTTKEAGKGTGLGLSTVYGIVRQSGGCIEIDSAPGKGSTFHIYLPQTAAVPTANGEGKRDGAASGGGETVLLAEDEELVRDVTRQMLEMSGYRVLVAKNGQEALELCERHPEPIHLMVTDVVMPNL